MHALLALQTSRMHIKFSETILFAPNSFSAHIPIDIKHSAIPTFVNVSEYSFFVLQHLHEYINTSHVLICQWDGFVLNPNVWSSDFLYYDYIGAPWPQFHISSAVGNGGFSLRSKKLLKTLLNHDLDISHPEDICICLKNRDLLENKYDIKFATIDIARKFSFEREKVDFNTFGFHGFFNFPKVFDSKDIHSFVKALPCSALKNRDATDLIVELVTDNAAESTSTIVLLLTKSNILNVFKKQIFLYLIKNPFVLFTVFFKNIFRIFKHE